MGKTMKHFINNLEMAAARVPWGHLVLFAGALALPSLLHAGPISTGVQQGTTEAATVGKYIGGAVGSGITLIGAGRVAYKVVNEEKDWGASLGMALLGLAIGGVALVA